MIIAWSALWLLSWLKSAEPVCSPTSYYKDCWIRRFPGLYIAVEESQRRGAALLQLYQEESALKCSRACCLSTNFSCNLAVFHYNTTQDSANCFHLHCPTLESCILRQRGNVILYNVTKGVDPDLLVFGNHFTSNFQVLPNQALSRLNVSEPFASDKRQFNRPHMVPSSSTHPATPASSTSTPTTSLTSDVPDSTLPVSVQSTQDTSPASSVHRSTLKTPTRASSTHVIANPSPHMATTTTTTISTRSITTAPKSSTQPSSIFFNPRSTLPLQPASTATTSAASFSNQPTSGPTYQSAAQPTFPVVTTWASTTASVATETRQTSTTASVTSDTTQTTTTALMTNEGTWASTAESVTSEIRQASTAASTTNEGTWASTTASITSETTQASTAASTTNEATWASTTASITSETTQASTAASTTDEATWASTTAFITSEITEASRTESTTSQTTSTAFSSKRTTTTTSIPFISTQRSTSEDTSTHSTLVTALLNSRKSTLASTLLTTVKTITQNYITPTTQPQTVMTTSQETKTQRPYSQPTNPLSPDSPVTEESTTQSPTRDGQPQAYTSNNVATTEDSTMSTRLHSQAAGSVTTSLTPPTSVEDSQPYPNDTKGYISRNITTGDSPRPGGDEGLTPAWHLAANTVLVALATCATIAFGCCCSVLMAVSWRGRRRRKGRYRTTLSGKRGSMRLIKYVIVRESS